MFRLELHGGRIAEVFLHVRSRAELSLLLACPQADADRAGIRKRLGLPATARIVLTVGRLVEQKGHEGLLRAVPEIVLREPP